jgi:hypothetical protein
VLHRRQEGSGGGNGAAAGAPIDGKACCEGEGGVRARDKQRGVRRGFRGTYIGSGRKGRRHPGGYGHQWPAALMGIQEGGKWGNCRFEEGE